MKTILLGALILVATNSTAFANTSDWLQCSTDARGVSEVRVGINPAAAPQMGIDLYEAGPAVDTDDQRVTITDHSTTVKSYEQMKQNGRITLEIKRNSKDERGISRTDTVFLQVTRLSTKRYTGYLVQDGSVYHLRCTDITRR